MALTRTPRPPSRKAIARVQLTSEYLNEIARRALAGEEILRLTTSLKLSRDFKELEPYDYVVADRILSHIAMGYNPLYLEKERWFPGLMAFSMWLVQEPEFHRKFLQSLQMFGYMAAFKALQAAEEPNIEDSKNFESKRKVIVETLLWLAGKANVKQFGQHVAISAEITDTVKINPAQTERGRLAFEELIETRRRRFLTNVSFEDGDESSTVPSEEEP